MKMSDALRGAAESAPVGDVHVSVGAVRTRARRARAVRVGANGVVGVGAAALVFAGVMGVVANQTGLATDTAGEVAPGQDAQPNVGTAGDDMVAAGAAADDSAAQQCGAPFDASAFTTDPATATISVDSVDDKSANITINTTGAVDAEYTTGQPRIFVLWNGIYVGGPQIVTFEARTWNSVAGETTSQQQSPPLINCWDGAALPAGDYTIVSAQDISMATVEAPAGEDPFPSASPSAASDPDAAVSSDAGGTDAVVTDGATTTIVSAPAAFTIAGEVAKDPFAKYLNPVQPTPDPAPTMPGIPSDTMSSAAARDAYNAALTSARWDMAQGTQRVVMTANSKDGSNDQWQQSYYGCPTDGVTGVFPAKSADLNWIDASANLPSSIHVSYGWIVDGNPVVHHSVTNVTDASLPGFYSGAAPHLVLVKDGRVVAEAYPVNPEQNGGAIAYAADAGMVSTDMLRVSPAGNGYLAPGESISGDYLWRDLNGCWKSDGTTTAVTPATYTLLSSQELYFGGQNVVPETFAADDGAAGGATASTSKAVAPAPTSDDYASFQIWTSLGTVIVTN